MHALCCRLSSELALHTEHPWTIISDAFMCGNADQQAVCGDCPNVSKVKRQN